jgi:hypothetical protein
MLEPSETRLEVRHVYNAHKEMFQGEVNAELKEILELGGVIGEIKYSVDASTAQNPQGGFGALIIFERPT